MFLDNQLTDGGEVVRLTRRRQPFTTRKIPGTPFCQRLSRPQAIVLLEELGRESSPRPSSL
jgi:hypothetical protein